MEALIDFMNLSCMATSSDTVLPSLLSFCSKRIPSISPEDYVRRFNLLVPESVYRTVYEITLIHLLRIGFMNSMVAHRLFAAAFVLSAKYVEETPPVPQIDFAKLAGIPVRELNRLELCFFELTGYNMFVTREEYLHVLGPILISDVPSSPGPVEPRCDRRSKEPDRFRVRDPEKTHS
jgi:hypothetical protein